MMAQKIVSHVPVSAQLVRAKLTIVPVVWEITDYYLIDVYVKEVHLMMELLIVNLVTVNARLALKFQIIV
jgi:hypothetical protein